MAFLIIKQAEWHFIMQTEIKYGENGKLQDSKNDQGGSQERSEKA